MSMLAFMPIALAKTPAIKDEGARIYTSRVASTSNLGRLVYAVDTVTQLCLMIIRKRGGEGRSISILKIECKTLARRPEWQPIITWLSSP